MIGSLETSLSSLNTHGLMAQAQQALVGQAGQGGQLPVVGQGILPNQPSPSLILGADALKAQEVALDMLDRVFSAANAVFQQVLPLWESRSAVMPAAEVGTEGEEVVDYRIRELLQSARFEGAPLFDFSRVNAQTLEGILKQPPETSRIELFSPVVRGRLTEAFEQVFDLYA